MKLLPLVLFAAAIATPALAQQPVPPSPQIQIDAGRIQQEMGVMHWQLLLQTTRGDQLQAQLEAAQTRIKELEAKYEPKKDGAPKK